MGPLLALALRGPRSAAPAPAAGIDAIAGAGLVGDRHANPLSPRQVLLASASAYADFQLPPQALGENLLVDFDTSQLASGTVLRIGETVLLRLMFQCEACGHLDAFQAGLSGRIGRRRGILARVLAGGAIHSGDRIFDLGRMLPAWDDDWRARVAQVLQAVPDGRVLTYRQLALLAGVQPTYCRAFPRLLARLGPGHAGKALSTQAAASRLCWDGQGLFGDAAYTPGSS